jgi:hypothetical protein
MSDFSYLGVPQCRVGLAPALLERPLALGGQRFGGDGPGAVGGDVLVLGPAGGDHGVQLPQDRGGDDGLGLGDGEPVGLSAGQMREPGGIDS